MPVVSRAQNAAMHAAAEGHSTLNIPKSVGKDFVNASHGMSVKHLPKHASRFKHHATAAHKAFASGDHKTAMHHAGHMLRMAKSAGSGTPMAEPDMDETTPAPMAPAAPATTGPSFASTIKSRFASLRGR